MLVLTRKTDESIVINGNITVKVLGIKGNRVRLGIVAPAEIAVHRSEVYLELENLFEDDVAEAECHLASAC